MSPVLTGMGPVQFVASPNGTNGATRANPKPLNPDSHIIDGTPIRVVMIALGAAVGIAALRAAGFRFNVGVSA